MAMPIGHFEDIQNEDAIEPYVDRIFELVGNRMNGVWSTQIDVEYKRKFQKSLPDKWPEKIESSKESSKKLRVDQPIMGRYIIYPNLNNEETNSADVTTEQNNSKNTEVVKTQNNSTVNSLENSSNPKTLKRPTQ